MDKSAVLGGSQGMGSRKVFVVGLSKTGTTSLHAALEQLGFRSVHNPESMLSVDGEALQFSTEHAKEYDALSDLPIAAFYRDLDLTFPGSRFILTTREEESWLTSCANHFDPSAFSPTEKTRKLVDRVYGSPHFDPAQFRKALQQHNQSVRDYFVSRPGDLLVVDTSHPEKWKALCEFLQLPIPTAEYPYENRAHRAPKLLKRAWRKAKSVLQHLRRVNRRIS